MQIRLKKGTEHEFVVGDLFKFRDVVLMVVESGSGYSATTLRGRESPYHCTTIVGLIYTYNNPEFIGRLEITED